MSKGSSRRRLPVTWNPARGVWETPETNLFCEHWELYSATWPASGSMRNGVASERTRSAPLTAAAASSSAPGRLFKTPTSNLGVNGGSQHPDKRRAGGHGPTLADEVEHLLPTPAARDWKSGESNLMDRNSRPLNEVVVNLLPTPRATRGGSATETMYELGAERTDEDRSQGEVKLLPTPAASFPGTTANFRPDGTPYSEGYGMTLLDAVRLLPTPRATDGTKGGPNQRGSKGDLMLPSAVSQLLPTPTASDSERTSSTFGRGNPTLIGAITDPPSDGGNESSDDEPPGQLTLLDD